MFHRHGIAVVLILLGLSAPVQADELTEHQGHRVIFEFPDLDDFGTRPLVPAGWRYVQVDADNFDRLMARLGVREIPALVFVDRHGNALHQVEGPEARARLQPDGVQAFEHKQRELETSIERLAREADAARRAGKQLRELQRVVELARLRVRGYEEIATARQRRAQLDRDRRRDLLELMSAEGLISSRKLLRRLNDLAEISAGLPVARIIQRHRLRLENGVTVARKSR